MLGAYKATPTAVLEAESDMPSIYMTLNHAQCSGCKPYEATHPMTIKSGKRRECIVTCVQEEPEAERPTPGRRKRKKNGALKSLGHANWKKVRIPTPPLGTDEIN